MWNRLLDELRWMFLYPRFPTYNEYKYWKSINKLNQAVIPPEWGAL